MVALGFAVRAELSALCAVAIDPEVSLTVTMVSEPEGEVTKALAEGTYSGVASTPEAHRHANAIRRPPEERRSERSFMGVWGIAPRDRARILPVAVPGTPHEDAPDLR